jgi:hypothetical protein
MLVIPWFLAIVLAAADEVVLSLLLRHEYAAYRMTWNSDGKPRGMFWAPAESRLGGWYLTYASGRAGRILAIKWLLQAPVWAKGDVQTQKLLIVHRVLMLAFVLALVAPFVIAGLFQ